MIYTLTLNPCIDYIMQLDSLNIGHNNRSSSDQYLPSGKGINVSLMLERLGLENIALGFLAGFTGDYLLSMLEDRHLNSDFIFLDEGMTRINVKLKMSEETEINSQGPYISESKLNELYEKIDSLNSEDVLFLSGSLAKGMPKDFYAKIMKSTNATVILDTVGEPLLECLKYHPYVIKPNQDELSELFGLSLKTDEEIIYYAKELQKQGARHVIVSLGEKGAILVSEEGRVLRAVGIKGEVVNTMCAGDSMLAGFIYGMMTHGDLKESIRLGSACGTATAFSNDLGEKEYIDELLKIAEVYEIIG